MGIPSDNEQEAMLKELQSRQQAVEIEDRLRFYLNHFQQQREEHLRDRYKKALRILQEALSPGSSPLTKEQALQLQSKITCELNFNDHYGLDTRYQAHKASLKR